MPGSEITFPEPPGLPQAEMSSPWCGSRLNDIETLGMRQHDRDGHLHSRSKLSKTALGKIKSDTVIQFLPSCSTHVMSKVWREVLVCGRFLEEDSSRAQPLPPGFSLASAQLGSMQPRPFIFSFGKKA